MPHTALSTPNAADMPSSIPRTLGSSTLRSARSLLSSRNMSCTPSPVEAPRKNSLRPVATTSDSSERDSEPVGGANGRRSGVRAEGSRHHEVPTEHHPHTGAQSSSFGKAHVVAHRQP